MVITLLRVVARLMKLLLLLLVLELLLGELHSEVLLREQPILEVVEVVVGSCRESIVRVSLVFGRLQPTIVLLD